MTKTEIQKSILESCEGTEWHLSLWMPRVAREVLGIPAGASDAEVQTELLRMIEEGVLEAGAVDGAEFERRALELKERCPDLYIRVAAPVDTLHG
jgi:hypothetical protein